MLNQNQVVEGVQLMKLKKISCMPVPGLASTTSVSLATLASRKPVSIAKVNKCHNHIFCQSTICCALAVCKLTGGSTLSVIFWSLTILAFDLTWVISSTTTFLALG